MAETITSRWPSPCHAECWWSLGGISAYSSTCAHMPKCLKLREPDRINRTDVKPRAHP